MHAAHKISVAFATLVTLGLAAGRPAQAQGYTFSALDDPSATSYTTSGGTLSGTVASGINDAGQVVGYYFDSTGQHGFVDTLAVGFRTLDVPGTTGSTGALGINYAGQIVGGYTDSTGSHGFLDTAAGFSRIDDPLATGSNSSTFATGINFYGQVVGNYIDSTGGLHGFMDRPGMGGPDSVFTSINDPDATGNTTARGINDNGQIAGEYESGKINQFGYLYTEGAGFTTISDPISPKHTVGTGVNDSGQVAGYYFNNTGQHGFVDTPTSGGTLSTFASLDDPFAKYGTYVQGINNAGQVVGYYIDANNVDHGFLATPAAVPEASSLASFGVLLLLGTGSLLRSSRKRAKTAA